MFAAALLLAPSALAGNTAKRNAQPLDANRVNFTQPIASKAARNANALQSLVKSPSIATQSQFNRVLSGPIAAPRARSTQRYEGADTKILATKVYDANNGQTGVFEISTTTGDATYITDKCEMGFGAILDGDFYRISTVYNFYTYTFLSIDSYDIANDWEYDTIDLDDYGLISLNMDKDPITGVVYGCFYNTTGDGYEFASADLETPSRNVICALSSAWCAFAFDANGQAYGLDKAGNLLKIDKTTGATSVVGNIGYTSKYVGSGAIDRKNNIFYCSVYPDDIRGYILAIDLSAGTVTAENVTVVRDDASQFLGMVIPEYPEDGAPAAAENIDLDFASGSLSGTVRFDIPSYNYAGVASTGNVNYEVRANGELVASGTSSYGASVEASVTVPVSAMYNITVVLSNDAGKSLESKERIFIGNDIPVTPEVTIYYEDGAFHVSWDAVTESLYDGYFDASQITYKVVRYPDNYVVAESTTETSLEDPVEFPETLISYTYGVQAKWADAASDWGISNRIVIGSLSLPYSESFSRASSISDYTIIDANGDGKTWSWDSDNRCLWMPYNTEMAMDDWLITPPIKMQAGKSYDISISARNNSLSNYPERISVSLGTAPTVAGMTTTLVAPTLLTGKEFTKLGTTYVCEADGYYYVGVRGCSDADCYYMYLNNITVSAGVLVDAPAAVENATITPGANGARTVDLSFTTPTKNYKGEDLTALTKVQIKRDGDVVKTFDAPALGAQLSYQDNVPDQGDYTYVITAFSDKGEGQPVTLTTHVGIAYPGKVTNVKLVENEDGNVTISWDPVTTDVNGSPLDSQFIKYQIRNLNESGYPVIVSDISSLDYNYDAVDEGNQEFIYLGVSAVTERGEGTITASDMIPVGTAYSTPYKESFRNQTLKYILGLEENMAETATWVLVGDATGINAYDGDNGYLCFNGPSIGSQARFFTGKISLKDMKSPQLSFATYNFVNEDDLTAQNTNLITIEVKEPGGIWFPISNKSVYDMIGEENPTKGWHKVFVSLSKYAGKDVQIRLTCTTNYYTYTLFDAFTVANASDYNLVAGDLTAPEAAGVNEEFDLLFSVDNDGSKDVAGSDYTVQLYCNDKLVNEVAGVDIKSHAGAQITLKHSLSAAAPTNNSYKAVINYAADEVTDNNTSGTAIVKLQPNSLNAPTDVTATLNDDETVNLTWTESEPIVPTETILESFEGGNTGDGSYSGWTFIDNDGELVGGPLYYTIPGIPRGAGKASFVVFNGPDCGITTASAHSGDQCLLSVSCYDSSKEVDDWAISPELSGEAQTISFYARSFSAYSFDSIEVLYSTTDNDINSFVSVATYEKISNEWTKYEVKLPAGALYFAIRNNSTGGYMLLLDDVSYISVVQGADLINPLGYNVYRNGEKINSELVTGTSFIDADPIDGTNEYRVSAVYEQGESVAAGPASIQFSAVNRINGKLNVYAENRTIVVANVSDANVQVMTLDGKLIYAGKGDAKVPVNNGVYVVKVGKTIAKIMVK